MEKNKKEKLTHFTLRLPEELLDLIRKSATRNRRSINNEIIYILEDSIFDRKEKTA